MSRVRNLDLDRIIRGPGLNVRPPSFNPTKLPPNILQGIGQIPRINLDFANLPKINTPINLPTDLQKKVSN